MSAGSLRFVEVLALLVVVFPSSAHAECEWISQFLGARHEAEQRERKRVLESILEDAKRGEPMVPKMRLAFEKARFAVDKALDLERTTRINALPDSEEVKRTLRARQIWVGATKDQACLAWGKPSDVNRTTTRTSVREQWVYENGGYLYFNNGVLTAIQN